MKEHLDYIDSLVQKGGPTPSEYEKLNNVIYDVYKMWKDGTIGEEELDKFRSSFGPAVSEETIQGFALKKPHGYLGDFEIMERVYKKYASDNEDLENWDKFLHSWGASKAVRNRKKYFKRILYNLSKSQEVGEINVLNIASGPTRGVYEFLKEASVSNIKFDCVDADNKAIEYGKDLCEDCLDKICFYEKNVFRFSSDKKYDLIWSAGLFDYLNDKEFKILTQRTCSLAKRDGEVIIGNFSKKNPNKPYMEVVGKWILNYRSKKQISDLAKECGIPEENIKVNREEEGINFFLRIKFGKTFI